MCSPRLVLDPFMDRRAMHRSTSRAISAAFWQELQVAAGFQGVRSPIIPLSPELFSLC